MWPVFLCLMFEKSAAYELLFSEAILKNWG
jgi:hypothetical protein